MKKNEKELLIQYMIVQDFRIEEEIQELRQRVRFRKITLEDCIELQLAMQRQEDFKEFSQNVCALLHLGKE